MPPLRYSREQVLRIISPLADFLVPSTGPPFLFRAAQNAVAGRVKYTSRISSSSRRGSSRILGTLFEIYRGTGDMFLREVTVRAITRQQSAAVARSTSAVNRVARRLKVARSVDSLSAKSSNCRFRNGNGTSLFLISL